MLLLLLILSLAPQTLECSGQGTSKVETVCSSGGSGCTDRLIVELDVDNLDVRLSSSLNRHRFQNHHRHKTPKNIGRVYSGRLICRFIQTALPAPHLYPRNHQRYFVAALLFSGFSQKLQFQWEAGDINNRSPRKSDAGNAGVVVTVQKTAVSYSYNLTYVKVDFML